MNELNAEKFRNYFAGKRVLVCLILAAAIGFTPLGALLERRRGSPLPWQRTASFPKAKQTTLGLYLTLRRPTKSGKPHRTR